MRLVSIVSVILAVLSIAAVSLAQDPPANLNPGEEAHYGAEFALEVAPVALNEALTTCADSGEACKVEAAVNAVCTRRGCWMTLTGEGVNTTVRVRMKDYGFFVPLNSLGANAVVEGVVSRVVVPEADAQHYADDQAASTGLPAEVIEGDQEGIEIMATGIHLTMPAAE